MHLQANFPLQGLNSFHLPAKARYIVTIYRASDIQALRSDSLVSNLQWKILGSGTNLIIDGDVDGVVVQSGADHLHIVKEDDHHVWLSVGAGMKWHDLVSYTVEKNWWGLENLALIPGTVGAAPVQNIGAYGAEIRDVVTRVCVFDLLSASRLEFRNVECNFNYRDSIFKSKYKNQMLVEKLTIRLQKLKAGKPNLLYEGLNHEVQAKYGSTKHLTPRDMYDAVVRIRTRKLPDPDIESNAGSFFKNPIIGKVLLNKLLTDYPDAPFIAMEKETFKIPAGWMIDTLGWRGYDDGRVKVYDRHALVLINKGDATAQDILGLSCKIQQDVLEKCNIHLEREVQIF